MSKTWPHRQAFFSAHQGGAAALVLLLLGSSIAVADQPVLPPGLPDIADLSGLLPTPTDKPPSPPDAADLQRWVRQLDDDDPAVRESALGKLMGLEGGDLPALRTAAVAQRPLSPGQLTALRGVVAQVYLASQKSPPDMSRGYPCAFLGMKWNERDGADDGAIVGQRFPGLTAYRMLQPGDIILKFIDLPNVALRHYSDFTELVSRLHPGGTLRLRILRYGRSIDVAVDLACRPQGLSLAANLLPQQAQAVVDNWLDTRTHQAAEYWKSQFSALDSPSNASAQKQP